MTIISLEGMNFFAHHGFYDEEQIIGNNYEVDLHFEIDSDNAANSDNISDTVNYESVYELIKAEMAVPSRLLEHLAKRISDSIKNKFPQIKSLELKISKLRPPVNGLMDKVSVTIKK